MTLYLSRLRLDPRNRATAVNLSRPYELHRTLLRAFSSADNGGPGRILFRIEPMPQGGVAAATVLVQSETQPNWIQAGREFPPGMLMEATESCDVPTDFRVGTILRFRVRANPTTRRLKLPDGTRDERKQRPRHALYWEEDQMLWLVRQGKSHGFELLPSGVTGLFQMEAIFACYDVVARNEGTLLTGKKTEAGVSRHHSVLFEGRLRVTDPSAFATALAKGIGPGKAFGFGLLSVAPGYT